MDKSQKEDLYQIQVRLFRLAQVKWNMSAIECSKLFNKFEIYNYIETCYDFFHIQGDDANLFDIEKYLKNNGFLL